MTDRFSIGGGEGVAAGGHGGAAASAAAAGAGFWDTSLGGKGPGFCESEPLMRFNKQCLFLGHIIERKGSGLRVKTSHAL